MSRTLFLHLSELFHSTGSRCHEQRKPVAIKVPPMFHATHQMPDVSEHDLDIYASTLFLPRSELKKVIVGAI